MTESFDRSLAAVRALFDAAIEAVDPAVVTQRAIEQYAPALRRSSQGRVFVAAFGKAAFAMARTAEQQLGARLADGAT